MSKRKSAEQSLRAVVGDWATPEQMRRYAEGMLWGLQDEPDDGHGADHSR
jgi:hypothetical protein